MRPSPVQVSLTRRATIPDPFRLARFRRAPELGPRLLFFSGGTALRETSAQLISYTHNSIHLMTPFDSGGSSAVIREAFDMISPGDLRNRMMALVDRTVRGHPQLIRLFAYRFDNDPQVENEQLKTRFFEMVQGRDPLVSAVPLPLQALVCSYLGSFGRSMPQDFDFRGASIGNLVLVGGYLSHNQDIDAVLFLFARLVEVRGIVRPIVQQDLHLSAQLENGEILSGQHRITSPDRVGPRIEKVQISQSRDEHVPGQVAIDERTRSLISRAELICYPIGSFFTSLSACLLPQGVGSCVSQAGCPKVYIANSGCDVESKAYSVQACTQKLLATLRADAGANTPVAQLLNYVVVDTQRGQYPGGIDLDEIRALGVEVLDLPLVKEASAPLFDPENLAQTLMSMV